MRRDALVVGINQYPFLKDTPTGKAKHLTTPAADAEAIAQVLEKYGNFRVKRLPGSIIDGKLQVDSSKSVKKEELEATIVNLFLPDSDNIPETALLFFAGHGLRKTLGSIKQGFLADSNASPNKEQWGMSLRDLQDILLKSPVKQQVIWLDCCFSGELFNFKENGIGQHTLGRDCSFIAASRDYEVAYQQLDGKHGLLTGAILKALDPDKLLDGEWLSNEKLSLVVREELEKYYKITKVSQSPLISNHGEIINMIQGKKNLNEAPVKYNSNVSLPSPNREPTEEVVERPHPSQTTYSYLYTLDKHSSHVRTVAISPDGRILASGSSDTTIKFWDLSTGELLNSFKAHSTSVSNVTFDNKGETIISGGNFEADSGHIKVWDVKTGKLKQTLAPGISNFGGRGFAFYPDAEIIAASRTGAVQLWDLQTGSKRYILEIGFPILTNALAFSPDWKFLVVGCCQGGIEIWDWRHQIKIRTINSSSVFDILNKVLWDVAISPEGKIIASCGKNVPFALWSFDSGTQIYTFPSTAAIIRCVTFSPDGNLLVSGGEDRKIRIIDARSLELLYTFEHRAAVNCLAFSPDGKTLVSGSEDNTIQVWRLDS